MSQIESMSRDPKLVRRYEPSSENASSLTPPVLKVCCSVPVAESQSRTVLKDELDASSRPSGEKATD